MIEKMGADGARTAAGMLAEAARRAGISQSEWSRRTQITQPQISRYLRGVADPSTAQLTRLLGAAGLSLAMTPLRPGTQRRDAARDSRITRDLLEVLALVDYLPRRPTERLAAKPFRELTRHAR